MIRDDIKLNNPEKYMQERSISRNKLIAAAEKATDKLLINARKFGFGYPGTCSKDYKYALSENTNWVSGMYTGCYWLAYELTGDIEFRNIAESHLVSYQKNIDEKININDHDVGFMYTPSCVAAYKLTGNKKAQKIAEDTVKYYYDNSYSKDGKFIIRSFRGWDEGYGCRTMMDSLMNAPFLFWAGREFNNDNYFDAAHEQNLTTEKYLIREDSSSYHHYQFDPTTAKPVKGVTLQGYSDESCWGRGHSWGIYGFPICYSYTKDELIRNVHKNITYYFLNRIPDDMIPYWDYIFTTPSTQPRDSSCAVISSCGLNEMYKLIPSDTEEAIIYKNASSMMLEAVIDKCTGDIGIEYDGLINKVTHALPQGQGIEECAVYGDYFYLEALMRHINPDWKMYW